MNQLAFALALAVGCSSKPSTAESPLAPPAVVIPTAKADVPATDAASADPTLDPTYIAPTDNGKQWRFDNFPSPPEPYQQRAITVISKHAAETVKMPVPGERP